MREEKIGEGEGNLSKERFPSPPKTFINGAGSGRGGAEAQP